MIGVEESKALFALLSAEKRSLEDIFSEFSSRFPRDVHFRICCSIAMLLEDKNLLDTSQRLIALSILQHTYSSQPPSSNPFISLLIDAACDDSSEKVEMAFIQHILRSVIPSNRKESEKKAMQVILPVDDVMRL